MVDVHVTLTVTGADDVPLRVTASDGAELTLGMPFYTDRIPDYEGPYTVCSEAHADQELQTRNKRMDDNLVVEMIPYAQVSNPAGGMTATIA